MADDRLDHRASASTGSRRPSGKRGADAQGLGRSRGGLSAKIHAAGDALGNPVRLIGSPGQRNAIAFADDRIEGFAPDVTIADKGYDADPLCAKIAENGGQPVIPPRRNRTFKRPYDAGSTRRATSSSAFSTSSSRSAASQRETTRSSRTSWASSNSPLSQSGQNSQIVTTT
jgi:putative transposase